MNDQRNSPTSSSESRPVAEKSPPPDRKDALLPKIRPDLEISEQTQGGRANFVVKDPVSLRYFRFGMMEYEAFQFLREPLTLSQLKEKMEKRFDVEFPEESLLRLLAMMKRADFFVTRGLEDYRFLYEMKKFRRRAEIKSWMFGFLYVKMPILDPDRFLNRTLPYMKFFFTRYFLILWVAVGALALAVVLGHLGNLREDLSRLGGWNMLLFLVSIGLVKSLHELAHAYTCNHFGGEVHEMGFMLLVLQPVLYTNVSDAWFFPTKRARLWTTASGIFLEIFLASLAVLLWNTTSAGFWRNFFFSTMMTCSVSTVIFNANPLLRYDGYYLLSDWLEVPNLRAKCRNYLLYLFRRYLAGRAVEFPPATLREKCIYVGYGTSSFIYRVLVIVAILFLIMRKFPYVGFALAVFYILIQFVAPAFRGVGALVKARKDRKALGRLGRTLGILASFLALLYFAPWRVTVRTSAIVLPAERTVIRSTENGFITEVAFREGETVSEGEALARLENPELSATERVLLARLDMLELRKSKVMGENPALAGILLSQEKSAEAELALARHRLDRLRVSAPRQGRVYRLASGPYSGRSPREWVGAYVREGEPILEVADTRDVILASLVKEEEVRHVSLGGRILFRPLGLPTRTFETRTESIAPTQLEEIEIRALILGAGGSIPTRPTLSGKERPLRPYYLVTGHIANPDGALLWGMTGTARIVGEKSSILQHLAGKVASWLRAKWDRVF